MRILWIGIGYNIVSTQVLWKDFTSTNCTKKKKKKTVQVQLKIVSNLGLDNFKRFQCKHITDRSLLEQFTV